MNAVFLFLLVGLIFLRNIFIEERRGDQTGLRPSDVILGIFFLSCAPVLLAIFAFTEPPFEFIGNSKQIVVALLLLAGSYLLTALRLFYPLNSDNKDSRRDLIFRICFWVLSVLTAITMAFFAAMVYFSG